MADCVNLKPVNLKPLHYWVDNDLIRILKDDDPDELIHFLSRKLDDYGYRGQVVLHEACDNDSVKCAEALITGRTPLTVDLNLPCCPDSGMYPLHYVASSSCPYHESPAMTELLIYYGARTDIRFDVNKDSHLRHPLDCYDQSDAYKETLERDQLQLDETLKGCANKLPLQIALQNILSKHYPSGWTPKDSIYKLITILCLPRLQNRLECIALLAGTTKETGEVFLEYAMEGKTVELAALLMVAPKESLYQEVVDRVHQQYDSFTESVQRLFETFDRVGDGISAFVRESKFDFHRIFTGRRVKELLGATGLSVMDSDVDISDDQKFVYKGKDIYPSKAPYEDKRCLKDFGMAHYSKSGYRWTVSNMDRWLQYFRHEAYINELEKELQISKKENHKLRRQQEQPNLRIWMEDQLWNALEKDDKEEFLSVVDRKLEFLGARQQQLLYAACCSGSVKCAEALIKGETPLTVDLNRPCTDTGLYPLHCAALSFFPSITELFLYHGARTDIRFTPQNPSDVFPKHLIERHAGKLPLEMALHGISVLPCIREWTFWHPIYKLVASLVLPRMQNALETLHLLAKRTEETKGLCDGLAWDGKLVEVAALLMVGPEELHLGEDVHCYSYHLSDLVVDDEEHEELEDKGQNLFMLFNSHEHKIKPYVMEDKYSVSKYQAIEDLTRLIPRLEPSDIDLSTYKWYREEEKSYPSEAPYEHVRLSPDVGMEHYSKVSVRWPQKKSSWRWNVKYQKMEHDLEMLQSENESAQIRRQEEIKPVVPYIFRRGVPIASKSFFQGDLNGTRAMSYLAPSFPSHNSKSRMIAVSSTSVRRASLSGAKLLKTIINLV